MSRVGTRKEMAVLAHENKTGRMPGCKGKGEGSACSQELPSIAMSLWWIQRVVMVMTQLSTQTVPRERDDLSLVMW